LTLAQIDRAIEWALRDTTINLNLWPDTRTYLQSNDATSFHDEYRELERALRGQRLSPVEVFGVGVYKDRGELKRNNIIIDRIAILDGDFANGSQFRFDYNPETSSYDSFLSTDISNNISYEIRFVCDDIEMDRIISQIMIDTFGSRRNLHGILNESLELTEASFWFNKIGPSVDLSGADYIERLWRFEAQDIALENDVPISQDVPPIRQVDMFLAPGGDPDQDAAEWATDLGTYLDTNTVPAVTAAVVDFANVLDLTFSENIKVEDQQGGGIFPFTFFQNGVEKTDLQTYIQPSINQLNFVFTSPFVSGDDIFLSYERDTNLTIVTSQRNIELERLDNRMVTNNL